VLITLHDAILENERRYDHNRSWRVVCQNISENVRSLVRAWNSRHRVTPKSKHVCLFSRREHSRTTETSSSICLKYVKTCLNLASLSGIQHVFFHHKCDICSAWQFSLIPCIPKWYIKTLSSDITISFFIIYESSKNEFLKLQLFITEQRKVQSNLWK